MWLFFLLQTCDIRASPQRGDQVIVSVVFSNLTDHNIKDLEFNVMDTMNLKLIRGVCISHVTILETFLAQLSRRLKWAFLIKICLLSIVVVVNFSHFHLLLQNHWTNFNQTWHKASLGEGDSSLFKRRAPPFSKGRNIRNSKNTLTNLKNILMQNHWTNFNQTWHKVSLGKGNSSLFKWRAPPFSKGR